MPRISATNVLLIIFPPVVATVNLSRAARQYAGALNVMPKGNPKADRLTIRREIRTLPTSRRSSKVVFGPKVKVTHSARRISSLSLSPKAFAMASATSIPILTFPSSIELT